MDKSPTIILSGDQVGARKVFLLSPSMSIILPNIITVTSEYIKGHMVSRNVFSKKGENGIVLVVGGSSIYHGAPLLASLAHYEQVQIWFILEYPDQLRQHYDPILQMLLLYLCRRTVLR